MTTYNIDKLSVDEKIGQLFMIGFDALQINDHAKSLIEEYKAGNIILFTRNFQSLEQLYQLTKQLQELALKTCKVPLFISIDQEGGMVTRIKNGCTFFPGAMTLCATQKLDYAYDVGNHMGEELKALGINMNLAPDLDVNNNPNNPVIGVRSYGDNPQQVAEFGSAFVSGLQNHIIATGKHFPGHGDTSVDSHLDLPLVPYPLERIHTVELVPFKKAIEQGIHAIMSSHINFPALTENNLPATLSKNCLTTLLREQLGFAGLIMTDCMEMKAIQTHYTTPEGALMAIKAGANLVCVSHTKELQIAAINRVKKALENNEISMEMIDDRVKKVLEYKTKYASTTISTSYQDVQNIVVNDIHKQSALQIVKEAVTLVKGTPLKLQKNVLLIASNPVATTIADDQQHHQTILSMVQSEFPQIDTLEITNNPSEQDVNRIIQQSKQYDQVLFCSYNANIYTAQLSIMKALQNHKNFHVFMMRNPYDTYFINDLPHVVAFYEYTPNSILALQDYLHEVLIPKGILPVTINE